MSDDSLQPMPGNVVAVDGRLRVARERYLIEYDNDEFGGRWWNILTPSGEKVAECPSHELANFVKDSLEARSADAPV